MAQVAIPNGYVKVDAKIITPGGRGTAMCTWGIRTEVDPDPDAVLSDIEAALNPWIENASTQTSLESFITHFGGGAPPYFSVETAVGQAGTQDGDPSPINTAVLVQKRTTTAGRPGRGRSYWPGFLVDTGVDDSSHITSGPLAGYQSAADDLLAAFEAGTLTGMVVLHLAGSSDVTPSLVTSYNVQSLVATQRRRLR